SASQNSFSSAIDVRCPAIRTDRFCRAPLAIVVALVSVEVLCSFFRLRLGALTLRLRASMHNAVFRRLDVGFSPRALLLGAQQIDDFAHTRNVSGPPPSSSGGLSEARKKNALTRR